MNNISKNYDKHNEETPTNPIKTKDHLHLPVENINSAEINQTKNNKDEIKYENEDNISESESEEFNIRTQKKNKNKKLNKKILKKRLKNTFINFDKFKSCTSKKNLQSILFNFTKKAKQILKFYLTHCFIIDIFKRKIENKRMLMAKRDIFYAIINNPEILSNDCHFDNNLLKNFCTGAGNFIKKHFFDIEYQISRNYQKNEI